MNFEQAEKDFKRLKAQFETGTLTEAEFKSQLDKLMIQDKQGSWWMLGYETEQWYRHDGADWVQANPYGDLSQKPEFSSFHPSAKANKSISRTASPGKTTENTPRKKSVWVAFLIHIFLGAGLFYARSRSLRKWIYPLAIVFILIGFFDLDYALGADIMDDSIAEQIAFIALFVYAAGFIDTWLALRKVKAIAG